MHFSQSLILHFSLPVLVCLLSGGSLAQSHSSTQLAARVQAHLHPLVGCVTVCDCPLSGGSLEAQLAASRDRALASGLGAAGGGGQLHRDRHVPPQRGAPAAAGQGEPARAAARSDARRGSRRRAALRGGAPHGAGGGCTTLVSRLCSALAGAAGYAATRKLLPARPTHRGARAYTRPGKRAQALARASAHARAPHRQRQASRRQLQAEGCLGRQRVPLRPLRRASACEYTRAPGRGRAMTVSGPRGRSRRRTRTARASTPMSRWSSPPEPAPRPVRRRRHDCPSRGVRGRRAGGAAGARAAPHLSEGAPARSSGATMCRFPSPGRRVAARARRQRPHGPESAGGASVPYAPFLRGRPAGDLAGAVATGPRQSRRRRRRRAVRLTGLIDRRAPAAVVGHAAVDSDWRPGTRGGRMGGPERDAGSLTRPWAARPARGRAVPARPAAGERSSAWQPKLAAGAPPGRTRHPGRSPRPHL